MKFVLTGRCFDVAQDVRGNDEEQTEEQYQVREVINDWNG